jgi:hypothetical protein
VICRRVPRVRAGYTRGGRQVGRTRVRRARVDGFLFSKPYPTRARRGYMGTTGTGTEVLGHMGRQVGNGTGRRVKRYNGLLNRYNDLCNFITFQQTVITIYETL